MAWLALGSLPAGAASERAPAASAEKTGEAVNDAQPAEAPVAAPSNRQRAKASNGAAANRAAERPPPSRHRTAPPPRFRGPDVTLIAGEERNIYEYRQNGQLRMIKVVPKFGKPYYLTPRDPTRGFGDLEQADMLLAEWVLWEF